MSKQINFSIGGFGERHLVEIVIDGKDISCEIKSYPDKLQHLSPLIPSLSLRPTVKSARELIKELDALDIFSWKESYDNPHVMDGTQWSLKFRDGNKLYESEGSNAYPDNWCWFVDWINTVCAEKLGVPFERMTYLKFTLGTCARGYKSVEMFISDEAHYKILRNEFAPVDKKPKLVADTDRLGEFGALNIFHWETNYVGDKTSDDLQWSLTFTDGNMTYRGRGSNAYPDNWDDFLDWLDALVPEMKFIDGNRIDGIELTLPTERLSLTRSDKTLTLEKILSTHTYKLDTESTKNFLDICQKFFDALEMTDDTACEKTFSVKLMRHNKSTTEFSAPYSDFAVPGLVRFADEIHAFAADLSAEIFCPENMRLINDSERIILCKVQFKGNYKTYTYRAEDETLAVGDVVDVPVGRNNDVTQAKIVDIGYFDESESPIPLDRIKTIIGKHVGNAWENY